MNLVPLSINHCSFPEYELVNRASCFIRSVLCDSCQSGFNNTPYILQRCSSTNSIQENNSLNNIHIFPNPASKELRLNGFAIDREYLVLLYDLSGRMIFKESIIGKLQVIFPLQRIAAGSYFLKISSAQEMRIDKVLLTQDN